MICYNHFVKAGTEGGEPMTETAYLVLENGEIFKGKSFGAKRKVMGEIVFTTGMTGYVETLTDPSYYGQIIVQTFPLIGNYGIIKEDFESKSVKAAAYIVKDWCQEPSNFRCEETLDTFLKNMDIPGLYDIDTRSLTKTIREYGTMGGIITSEPKLVDLAVLKNYYVHNPVEKVSIKEKEEGNISDAKYQVALIDFGLKQNIKRELIARGCNVTVYPHDVTASELLQAKPDGIMLSNGPGDPEDNPGIIKMLREIIKTGIPIFGICLGHQLLALANGFKTTKLKYGHRGTNQPVMEQTTGKVYITSQNHGFAVESDSIDKTLAIPEYCNLNDGTCEGIDYKNYPVFSVQFHPEACGGPKDTGFLFDKFIAFMEAK